MIDHTGQIFSGVMDMLSDSVPFTSCDTLVNFNFNVFIGQTNTLLKLVFQFLNQKSKLCRFIVEQNF